MLFFYQTKTAGQQSPTELKKYTQNILIITGGNIMAIAAGILVVSGVITYEFEKNAPSVLGE